MRKWLDYTTIAYRHTAKFPQLTYIGKQVNFWIVANMLLATILYLQTLVISYTYGFTSPQRFGAMILVAIVLGLIIGICLGITGYYQDRKLFRTQSLGRLLIFKTLTSLAVLFILLSIVRYLLFDRVVLPSLQLQGFRLSESAWGYIVLMLMIYFFFMSMVANFINQVNKKYGPGVIIPLLLGLYRKPREEERIFMFMDLRSSTATAEKLGHLKYSSFIRDCFADINEMLYPFRAQVYQYVGDEIVLTWPQSEGLKQQHCILFYFAVKQQFLKRKAHYVHTYGLMPEFKAGVHAGMVTLIEIGELKREIAYHGDTLNTAARIQSVCNTFGKDFIASQYLVNMISLSGNMKFESLGMVQLKGKGDEIELVGITMNVN